MTSLTVHSYIVPVIAGIIVVILFSPAVEMLFRAWIPDPWYSLFVRVLLLIAILFLISQALGVTLAQDCPPCTSQEDNKDQEDVKDDKDQEDNKDQKDDKDQEDNKDQ